MAFVLNSNIKIGSYAFTGGVHELTIKKNIHVIVDTAKLEIPGLGQVVSIKSVVNTALNIIGLGQVPVANNLPNSSVQTAKLFNEGDKVSIDLGYNGDLCNEFRGFVRRVNLTTPVSIEMEGYAWQLRNQNFNQSWKATTVRDVLTFIIQGTDIVLSPNIPVIALTDFKITNVSGLTVLDDFKNKMLLTVYFADNVLYAGIEEGRVTYPGTHGANAAGPLAQVNYNIGYNCISQQPDLKQRLAKDNLVLVKMTAKTNSGVNVVYQTGDANGEVHNTNIPFIKDAAALKVLGDDALNKLKYDGFEGKVTGFLQPYCLPGWQCKITDKRYAGARAGTYFVAGTEVTYGVRGAKRLTEITYRIS